MTLPIEMLDDSPKIRVIEMWPIFIECWLCGAESRDKQGLATYEDLIVPDDWAGDWCGHSVCEPCYTAVRKIQDANPSKVFTKRTMRKMLDDSYL